MTKPATKETDREACSASLETENFSGKKETSFKIEISITETMNGLALANSSICNFKKSS